MVLNCLRSTFAQTHKPIQVILVDNCSSDDSVDKAQAEFPALQVVRNAENRWFTTAQNQALAISQGEFYMALNPDVELEPNYVEELVGGLESNFRGGDADLKIGYGIGKVRVLERDRTRTDLIYSTGHLFPRNRQGYNRGINSRDRGDWDQPEIIPGANGSCPIYRMEMVRDLMIDGIFWETIFPLYGDDLDIDWRAAIRGWKCLYWPAALAHHVGMGSGVLLRDKVYATFVAHRYLMMLKNDRLGDLLHDFPWFAAATLREMAALLFTRPRVFFLTFKVFFAKAGVIYRRRRVIQARRTHEVRNWFDLSLQLIRRKLRKS